MTIKKIKDLVQSEIDKGATTVEEVHKTIANMPLNMLSNIGILQEPLDQAKAFQDNTIGSIYDAIRSINKTVGECAEELLPKTED